MDEIDKFIDLGNQFEVDNIYFGRLDNWGTFEEEEFRERSAFLVGTRKQGDALKEIMAKNKKWKQPIINWLDINENFKIKGFYDDEQ